MIKSYMMLTLYNVLLVIYDVVGRWLLYYSLAGDMQYFYVCSSRWTYKVTQGYQRPWYELL